LRTSIGSFCCFFAPKCRKPDAADAEIDVAAKKAKARLAAAYFRKIIVCDSCDALWAIMALRAESKQGPTRKRALHAVTYNIPLPLYDFRTLR
jgi:hypothetical protein